MSALGVGALRARFTQFLADPDPLLATTNATAMLVWSNQPFYPLYVWLLAGSAAGPSLLTWLSTPLFVAVAPVGRRHSVGGRVLLVIAGLANTMVAIKAYGWQSGVGWFLVPCLLIALTLFRAKETKIVALLVGLTVLCGFFARHLGQPLAALDATQSAALSKLHLWSAGFLSLFLLIQAARRFRAKD